MGLSGETFLRKGSANSGGPLCPSDISPHCGESSSNSFPKTFSMKFQPDRVRIQMNMEFKIFWTHPIGLKFVLKVFERFPPINT